MHPSIPDNSNLFQDKEIIFGDPIDPDEIEMKDIKPSPNLIMHMPKDSKSISSKQSTRSKKEDGEEN